jgi:hypothetical protein
MEVYQHNCEEKDVNIFQLEKENESLREKIAGVTSVATVCHTTPARSKTARRQSTKLDNFVSAEIPITYGNKIVSTGKSIDNTFNNFNSY